MNEDQLTIQDSFKKTPKKVNDLSLSLGSSSPDGKRDGNHISSEMFSHEPISQTREHRVSKTSTVTTIGQVPVSIQTRRVGKKDDSHSKLQEEMKTNTVSILSVPYSEHSSFNELHACVKWFDPVKVIPTVNCRSADDARSMVELLRRG